MLLKDLIDRLEELAQDHPDAEIRLMTQSQWPMEYTILGTATKGDMNDESDRQEAERLRERGVELDDEDEVGPRKGAVTGPEIIYLVEGSQLGYGSKAAWNVCER
jgi:hypothetical protein